MPSLNTMRHVTPFDINCASAFQDNTVTNSRYTTLNFIPKNLYEQFRKPLNFYFLMVAALQFISVIAPVNPLSTLLPLLFAFTLTAVKEGYDDIKRHQQDSVYNNRRYMCLDVTSMSWVSTPSCKLRVGDVLKIRNHEEIPCDVVCVAAPEHAEGVVYVRTDNLDGELDLKPKDVVPILEPMSASTTERVLLSNTGLADLIARLKRLCVVCPPPNATVDSFDARRDMVSEEATSARSVSLNAHHLLPQACVLKNTEEAIVVVVYTGSETKCGMNKHSAPAKWASIDQAVSKYATIIFVCQLICAFTMGLVGYHKNADTAAAGYWYLGTTSTTSDSTRYVIYQLRFFLLTTVMIPVSFKFVVDLSKHFMALVLEWDLAMYNDAVGEGIKVRNSSIVEDLGQIEFVLSDKTGTMTENVMLLKHISVDGVKIDVVPAVTPTTSASTSSSSPTTASSTGRVDSAQFEEFLMCALLCNTVEVDEALSETLQHTVPTYHAASPDEEAICRGVVSFGCLLKHRNKTHVAISLRGGEHKYRILRVFPFSSEKKSMGVVVEQMSPTPSSPDRAIRLIVKGADDKVFSLASAATLLSNASVNSDLVRQHENGTAMSLLQPHLDDFARHGLRTLVFASKWISRTDYDNFDVQYVAALNQVDHRAIQCDALELAFQKGVEIVGGTAIEDKLQEAVHETIEDLIAANVKMWMLTGDKIETAEQIALTCGLIHIGDRVLRLTNTSSIVGEPSWEERLMKTTLSSRTCATTRASTESRIGDSAETDSSEGATSTEALVAPSNSTEAPFVVIVQGGALLDQILHDEVLRSKFQETAMKAKSVICARVTPSQKALVTQLVRSSGHMTLAIGDGGNDVAMIQQAHVGVGLCGKEGSQASRAADFSVSKFSHLRSLMLYHGHASYARTSYVVQYSFYKSMLICFIQLIFNIFATNMSGASFWNSFELTMWNGVYTLPQTLCYCLDRTAPRRVLEQNPFLYRLPQKWAYFNWKTFFGYVVRGILQSAALFWFVSMAVGRTYAEPDTGFSGSQDVAATIAYSSLILHQVFTVLVESHSVTIVNFIVIIGMPVFYYVTVYIYGSMRSLAYYGVFQRTDNFSGFLFALGIAASLFLPHFAFIAVKEWYAPNPRVVLRQRALMQRHIVSVHDVRTPLLGRSGSICTTVKRVSSKFIMDEEPSIFCRRDSTLLV